MKKGRVIKSTGNLYLVECKGNELINCKISGKYRLQNMDITNPVAVGDLVECKINELDSQWTIIKIEKRKNYIIRKSSNLSKQAQIIASNVDLAFLIVTIEYPQTHEAFIDRFLASAEAYNIPVILIFNKIDLYNSKQKERLKKLKPIYEKIGYQCIELSAINLIDIENFKNIMKDKINVICGNSGVGKSTFINRISPGLSLKTNNISNYHNKGKHTTVFSEMFPLPSGGFAIDTPGIKGFGLFDFSKNEIFHFYPEIFKVSVNCRFNNCLHINEPGCAVLTAVENEDIAESRYKSYSDIFFENSNKHR